VCCVESLGVVRCGGRALREVLLRTTRLAVPHRSRCHVAEWRVHQEGKVAGASTCTFSVGQAARATPHTLDSTYQAMHTRTHTQHSLSLSIFYIALLRAALYSVTPALAAALRFSVCPIPPSLCLPQTTSDSSDHSICGTLGHDRGAATTNNCWPLSSHSTQLLQTPFCSHSPTSQPQQHIIVPMVLCTP
jgi:hypothetical protein